MSFESQYRFLFEIYSNNRLAYLFNNGEDIDTLRNQIRKNKGDHFVDDVDSNGMSAFDRRYGKSAKPRLFFEQLKQNPNDINNPIIQKRLIHMLVVNPSKDKSFTLTMFEEGIDMLNKNNKGYSDVLNYIKNYHLSKFPQTNSLLALINKIQRLAPPLKQDKDIALVSINPNLSYKKTGNTKIKPVSFLVS